MIAARWSAGMGAVILAFFLSATCRAQEVLPAWSADANKAWWTAHPTFDSWSKGADELQAGLDTIYQRNGARCFSIPDFQEWMEHLEWVRLGLAAPEVVGKPGNLATFIALGEDETVSHLLVEKMVPGSVKGQALQNLITLAQANMADLHEYAALGVAYSLVFDEPFPADWPHAQVDQSAVPIGDLDIVKRFEFYVQANRDKKTELDLTQLRVEDLKYLVDSEVKLSELAYGQDNRVPYDHFADAFFNIKYDTARVTPENQVFKWAQPTYTLKDIETDGGICVDQAYYASEIGKGRGIPTIYFTGQGTDGGHAWFGYLSRSGKWELDCGRYASQNYPKGYALDPETWQVVNDATLENLAKNGGSNSNYQPAENALAWARLHAGKPMYRQILDDALTLMPELTDTWHAEADYLDQSGASIDDKKAFYQKWITQFTSFADMKVEGQKRLLAALKAANDPDADSLQQDIVLENRSTGFDLGVQGSSGEIADKFKAQDWDGAKLAFETSVRDFKDQGGGTFFNQVVEPYVMECAQYGRFDQAEDGLHFTEERMPLDSQSIIGIEFAKLKDRVKELKDALPAMDKWLGELDDANYAQAWNDSSRLLQGVATSDQFAAGMQEERKGLGKCTARVMSAPPSMGDQLSKKDGTPLHGEFLEGQYDTTFEGGAQAAEQAIFVRDGDGAWRMLQYRIRKK